MTTSTKPPGPKTGYAHPRCYAAPLHDCSRKITREHAVSRTLLKRFGERFMLDGMPWARERLTTPDEAASKVLCERHNTALSPLDDLIGQLYDALRAFREGRAAGWCTINGGDLERWVIKAMIGLLESNNVLDIESMPVVTDSGPPQPWLRFLFGEAELPDGYGFHFISSHLEGMDADQLNVAVAKYPDVHPRRGGLFGMFVTLVDFPFLVSMEEDVSFVDAPLHYRPHGIKLGDLGCVRLRWRSSPSRSFISLPSPTFS